MLKICEITVKAGEEPVPKVRFKMPIAPVSMQLEDSPAPTPAANGLPKLKFTSSASAQTLPRISIPRCTSGFVPHRTNCEPSDSGFPPAAGAVEGYEPDYEHALDSAPLHPKKIKVRAPSKMEQAQASGMSMSDVTACKSMIKKLLREKCSLMFRTPVGESSRGHTLSFLRSLLPMQIPSKRALLGELSGFYDA